MIQHLHNLDPPKGGGGWGINFNDLPRWEGIWKIKKGGGILVQGQVFLKGRGGGWHFPHLIS